jgi:hypothetical protein
MAVEDFLGVLSRRDLIPNPLGVDDDGGSPGAVIETAGRIRPDPVFQSPFFQLGLEEFPDFLGTSGTAAASWVIGIPAVRADEDMFFKRGHVFFEFLS